MLVSQSRPMCWYSRRLPFSRKGTWCVRARLDKPQAAPAAHALGSSVQGAGRARLQV